MDGIVEDVPEREEQREESHEESTRAPQHESDGAETQPESSHEPDHPRATLSHGARTLLQSRVRISIKLIYFIISMQLEEESDAAPTEEHCSKRR